MRVLNARLVAARQVHVSTKDAERRAAHHPSLYGLVGGKALTKEAYCSRTAIRHGKGEAGGSMSFRCHACPGMYRSIPQKLSLRSKDRPVAHRHRVGVNMGCKE